MNLPNPMVTELADGSGQHPYWALERVAMDARFGSTGNPPAFRVSTGDLVPKRNSVGGHYAPGLGGGGTLTGDRFQLPSDLGKFLVLATQPNKPSALDDLTALDRLVGLADNGGTLVNLAA
jgi:hypothetical protein